MRGAMRALSIQQIGQAKIRLSELVKAIAAAHHCQAGPVRWGRLPSHR